mmetsp:Transcript_39810/g.35536  ORF Transcript_39810/g.35536 Transcript_39810/m.35536 type:complete len:100 (-) Transcript_39810:75-374(-)
MKFDPEDPAFFKAYKGFSAVVTDFDVSPNGKLVVAASEDNTFRVFVGKSWDDQNPASAYQKTNPNTPTSIGLSTAGPMVAMGVGDVRKVIVYSLKIEAV